MGELRPRLSDIRISFDLISKGAKTLREWMGQ